MGASLNILTRKNSDASRHDIGSAVAVVTVLGMYQAPQEEKTDLQETQQTAHVPPPPYPPHDSPHVMCF